MSGAVCLSLLNYIFTRWPKKNINMTESIDASQQSLQRNFVITTKWVISATHLHISSIKLLLKTTLFQIFHILTNIFYSLKKIWNQEKKSILQHECPLIGTWSAQGKDGEMRWYNSMKVRPRPDTRYICEWDNH